MRLKSIFCSLLLLCLVQPLCAKAPKDKTKPATIRFMDFNIADGMWWDQFNNYDRFVQWMQAQKIDIFAVCEAATHWDKKKKNVPKNDDARYLPGKWGELAARWGHSYTALGAYQDNYPVAVTSRYPIELVQRIGGKNISHGAIHVKILGVNYVVLHLWPQAWHKDDKTRTKGSGGDRYRLEEIQYIMNQTILNPKYASEKHWVMTGDFNSRSPKDNDFYAEIHRKKPRTFNNDVHNAVLEVYPHDAIFDKNPSEFQSSTRGKARIDYIYCTKKLYSAIKKAYTIRDDFVRTSSDHCPLVMEFKSPKR